MRVLGIDPGIAIMGWSLIEPHPSGEHEVVFGAIETPAHLSLNQRLARLYVELGALIDLYKPDALALETLFFVKNAKTLAMVAHARGVILLAAGLRSLNVFEYAPRQVKLSLTGYGAAGKIQVQQVLQRMLRLTTPPKPDDAADAIAVGLCHVQYAHSLGRSAVTV